MAKSKKIVMTGGGNPALPGVRQGFPPGRAAAVLLPDLRPCCKAAEAARLYAEIPGVEIGRASCRERV